MTEVTEITTEEAQEVIQQELQERAQQCSDAVQEVLGEYSCSFDISLTITGRGQVLPNMTIIANPK